MAELFGGVLGAVFSGLYYLFFLLGSASFGYLLLRLTYPDVRLYSDSEKLGLSAILGGAVALCSFGLDFAASLIAGYPFSQGFLPIVFVAVLVLAFAGFQLYFYYSRSAYITVGLPIPSVPLPAHVVEQTAPSLPKAEAKPAEARMPVEIASLPAAERIAGVFAQRVVESHEVHDSRLERLMGAIKKEEKPAAGPMPVETVQAKKPSESKAEVVASKVEVAKPLEEKAVALAPKVEVANQLEEKPIAPAAKAEAIKPVVIEKIAPKPVEAPKSVEAAKVLEAPTELAKEQKPVETPKAVAVAMPVVEKPSKPFFELPWLKPAQAKPSELPKKVEVEKPPELPSVSTKGVEAPKPVFAPAPKQEVAKVIEKVEAKPAPTPIAAPIEKPSKPFFELPWLKPKPAEASQPEKPKNAEKAKPVEKIEAQPAPMSIAASIEKPAQAQVAKPAKLFAPPWVKPAQAKPVEPTTAKAVPLEAPKQPSPAVAFVSKPVQAPVVPPVPIPQRKPAFQAPSIPKVAEKPAVAAPVEKIELTIPSKVEEQKLAAPRSWFAQAFQPQPAKPEAGRESEASKPPLPPQAPQVSQKEKQFVSAKEISLVRKEMAPAEKLMAMKKEVSESEQLIEIDVPLRGVSAASAKGIHMIPASMDEVKAELKKVKLAELEAFISDIIKEPPKPQGAAAPSAPEGERVRRRYMAGREAAPSVRVIASRKVAAKDEFSDIVQDVYTQLKATKTEDSLQTAMGMPKAAAKPAAPATLSFEDLLGEEKKPAQKEEAAPSSLFSELSAINAGTAPSEEKKSSVEFVKIEAEKGMGCPTCHSKNTRIIFCPYCGTGMCANCSPKITPKADHFVYVCPKCLEDVTVKKKTPASSPMPSPA